MCQSRPIRQPGTMLRLSLLLVLLTNPIRTYVTDAPSFADRLDKLYEKIEKFNSPKGRAPQTAEEKLYAKLERLNSLSPDKSDVSGDDEEELLSAMQSWATLSPDQLHVVYHDLQKLRAEEEKSERIVDRNEEYGEGDWNDEFQDELELPEGDYPNDKDWDSDDDLDTGATMKPVLDITPSGLTRLDAYKDIVVSAVDPIAATNERPRILDDSALTPKGRNQLRHDATANMMRVVRSSKCLIPQARWFTVRQLAPAADTVYMPPCVQLHRCAPDAGCCNNEAEVCAPIDGKYVAIPFYLHKADGRMPIARMLFFNHTQCACVSRETLQSTVRTRIDAKYESRESRRDLPNERQNDWRVPTEEPKPENEEPTRPTLIRRCTCPALFLANMPENGSCSCVCDWPETVKRRDCLSLARGKEHFGLRDRVCVDNGDCNPPTCEYGAYDRSTGKCPLKRFRRLRFQHRARYQPDKTIVV
ncbi:uncharacterized protein LOC115444709 isoform X2 [Manduca sexta]|uniref:uncharacterized protein LOC115444709 isoform X2 n=1 Tax=Manduca sexta TaxID=7130 RepID=UPI001182CD36|nr:uncharacterized protein LOC115444709 isoform X2 [Manduca sexta]